ncbi:MAG TPA: energy transducer TonB [Hyphomicrobiaceae bacterium]|jgi:protein TonB
MRRDAHVVEPYLARLLRWTAATVLVTGMHIGGGAFALLNWKVGEIPVESAGSVAIELAPMAVASPVDSLELAHGPPVQEAAPAAQAANKTLEEVEKELPMVDPSPLAPEPEVALPTSKPVEEKTPEEQGQESLPEQQNRQQAASVPLTTAPPQVVSTKTAAAAAGPVPGTSAIPTSVQASWQKALIRHLNRFKRYPESARSRGIQGIVEVEFTINRAGRVVTSRVTQSSGSSSLDAEALATLRRANPLPAPPLQAAEATLDLALPIHFRIR